MGRVFRAVPRSQPPFSSDPHALTSASGWGAERSGSSDDAQRLPLQSDCSHVSARTQRRVRQPEGLRNEGVRERAWVGRRVLDPTLPFDRQQTEPELTAQAIEEQLRVSLAWG